MIDAKLATIRDELAAMLTGQVAMLLHAKTHNSKPMLTHRLLHFVRT